MIDDLQRVHDRLDEFEDEMLSGLDDVAQEIEDRGEEMERLLDQTWWILVGGSSLLFVLLLGVIFYLETMI